MRISDWSSDVCSSDLERGEDQQDEDYNGQREYRDSLWPVGSGAVEQRVLGRRIRRNGVGTGAAGRRPVRSQGEALERAGGLPDFGALVLRQRNQSAVRKVAARTEGVVAGELGDIFPDARDSPDVRLLHEIGRAHV